MDLDVRDYEFHTTPKKHQLEVFAISRDEEAFALLMDPGTGKTKVIIDNTAYLYNKGRINALLVIAPNGVHQNWILEEIPKHLPPYIERDAVWYKSSPNASEKRDFAQLYNTSNHSLKILAMHFESLSTAKGLEAAKTFCHTYKVLIAVDESTGMKNHKAKRTEAIVGLRRLGLYRRILTGTPVTEGPEDLFAPFEFLDPYFLPDSSYYAHVARFCELVSDPGTLVGLRPHEVRQVMALRQIRSTPQGRRAQLEARDADGKKMYKNLDQLHAVLAKHSYRVTKEQAGLDLPPKIFTKLFVELTPAQRRIYNELVRDRSAELAGKMMTTRMALTNLLRLQQVVGGFFSPDIDQELDADELPTLGTGRHSAPALPIDSKNARIEVLLDDLERSPGKAIIWARFKAELVAIRQAIEERFGAGSACELHGGIPAADRQMSIRAFQNEDFPKYAVANPAAKGVSRGQTMTRAEHVYYFSNTFSLEDRLQSEDRPHRIGLDHPVRYVDMVALDTVDDKIITALRSKKDVADAVTGDEAKGWI